ncbi:hypothetical protein [Streptomyces sp. NPDC020330]|uniref:hypothetical protein n=1 Tax=unclassified Streptomyces TaxID=2593676 RepID=UPI00378FF41C
MKRPLQVRELDVVPLNGGKLKASFSLTPDLNDPRLFLACNISYRGIDFKFTRLLGIPPIICDSCYRIYIFALTAIDHACTPITEGGHHSMILLSSPFEGLVFELGQ